MIGEPTAHSTQLPIWLHPWLWRYTCLLVLIMMHWQQGSGVILCWMQDWNPKASGALVVCCSSGRLATWLNTRCCHLLHKPNNAPVTYNAPYYNKTVLMCAHFCYKIVHCGIFVECVTGYVRKSWLNVFFNKIGFDLCLHFNHLSVETYILFMVMEIR